MEGGYTDFLYPSACGNEHVYANSKYIKFIKFNVTRQTLRSWEKHLLKVSYFDNNEDHTIGFSISENHSIEVSISYLWICRILHFYLLHFFATRNITDLFFSQCKYKTKCRRLGVCVYNDFFWIEKHSRLIKQETGNFVWNNFETIGMKICFKNPREKRGNTRS